MDPLGPVVITAREIYDQLVRVVAELQRLNSHATDQGKDLQDHESRIRALEKGRWPVAGVTIVIAIAALVLPFLVKIK